METKVILKEIKLIRQDVQALKVELHRYKGFVGGVAWSLSALTALVGFLWGVITNHG